MKVSIKTIREAYDALDSVFYSANTNYAEVLLKRCMEEEKGHRGWGPSFRSYHPSAASVRDMAKMFAVRRVAEYMTGEKLPEVKDLFSIHQSCFMAACIVENYRTQISEAMKYFILDDLKKMDYCDYVKVSEPKQKG